MKSDYCKFVAPGKIRCKYPKGTIDFELGERVEYDVYPIGKKIPAIITEDGPRAIGLAADCLKEQGYSPLCDWDNTDAIRKVKVEKNPWEKNNGL
jgi:hypothetical protein